MIIKTYLGIALLLLVACSSVNDSGSENSGTGKTNTIYTWVELYADGHRDTVYSTNTDTYPTEIAWETESSYDSVYAVDTTGQQDTVYLNYGPKARDSLAPPRVQIKNKDSILSALDTLLRYQPMWPRANVEATHFRGDSLQEKTSDSTYMAFLLNPSTMYCTATDSCSIGFTHTCMYITYQQDATFSNDFAIYPDRFDSSEVHWKFVLSNRFGFSDSLEGMSIIKSPTLSCKNPQVDFCQPMIVYPRERHLFSWVEGYADGRRDTIFSSDSSRWPGYASTKLTSSSYTAVIFTTDFMRVVDTVQVCPGDSLVLDSLGGYPTLYAKPDTIHLNYSADSLYPFILPKVEFAEKDSLIALASTAQYFTNPMNLSLDINHFQDDSATVELLNPSLHYVYWSATTENSCPAQDPCSSEQIMTCDEILRADASVWPHLGMTIDSTTSGDFPWTLIVRNRFGFADTVSGTTNVSPFSCAESD